MELKYGRQREALPPLPCFNRTFMELKFGRGYGHVYTLGVLIVPLWN